MAVGAEKVKDSGLPGAERPGTARRRDRTDPHRRRHVLHGRPGLRGQVRGGRRPDDRRAGRHLGKNHANGATQPAGPVPPGSVQGDDLRLAPGGRAARGLRLRRGGRRVGGGHRGAGRGRPALHRQTALHEGALLRRRERLGADRPRLRLHPLPRVRGGGGRRLPPGRDHRPPAPTGHGRGARLLHPDRAGPDGGSRASPSGARPGRRCWPGRSPSTASCRSTPTAG